MARALLRLPEVLARVPYRRARLYGLIRAGEFPAPIPVGPRLVAWDSDAVQVWIERQIANASSLAVARVTQVVYSGGYASFSAVAATRASLDEFCANCSTPHSCQDAPAMSGARARCPFTLLAFELGVVHELFRSVGARSSCDIPLQVVDTARF